MFLARPCALTEPVVVYSLGVIPLLSTCAKACSDQLRAARYPRRAKSRGDTRRRAESSRSGSKRVEPRRAVPSGTERQGRAEPKALAVVETETRASSTTPPERVCAYVRLYSLRFPPRVSRTPRLSPRRRRGRGPTCLSIESAQVHPSARVSGTSAAASRQDQGRFSVVRVASRLVFLARVCAASFPAGPRACMDDTRARADEDIALDSCRLRSSARLGFAASTAAAAAAAASAVTATAITASTATSTTTSAVAATCRVARRKRKKRRRQRLPANNDDSTGVAVAVSTRSSAIATPSGNAAVADTAADAVVVLEPDADANAATAGLSDSVAARVDKPPSRSRHLASEQHTASAAAAASSGEVQLRVGGSGTRAAASSVGTAGVTLLNRRAGKRSPRRCNAAGGRKSAMTMDLQRLISEVHARPAIWDQKNVNYHNRDVILKMWREIARACEVSSEYKPARVR